MGFNLTVLPGDEVPQQLEETNDGQEEQEDELHVALHCGAV